MRTVRYADLDITKPAGAKVLYRRIKAAAEQVCGGEDSLDLAIRARNRACIEHAVNTAVQHVDSPALSALHPAAALQLARR